VWLIEYNSVAEASILDLDKPVRQRILAFMKDRVAPSQDPKVLAEPLHGELQGLWRFRAGDYRIICDIHDRVRVVEVVEVGHRSKIYLKPLRRSGKGEREK
jgi:mRNA interferase RelE/StbE